MPGGPAPPDIDGPTARLRPRARERGPIGRLLSVARYEMAWDLKKFWVYLSVVLMVVLAIVAVSVGHEFIDAVDHYLPAEYPVTFNERGLAPGSRWMVSIQGFSFLPPAPQSSTGSSITIMVGNGTYTYTIGSAEGNNTSYAASPSTGGLSISGAPTAVPISFTAPSAGPVSFSTAAALAQTSANTLGGNWSLVTSGSVSGNDFTRAYTNSSEPNNGYCLLTGGSGSWPTVPAWTGNYSDGLQADWQLEYAQIGLGGVAQDYVVVANGMATNVGFAASSFSSGSTTCAYPSLSSVTGTPIDSTAAAAALQSSALAFLRAHPQADSTFRLQYYPPIATDAWNVTYTTCNAGSGGSGFSYNGIVNAQTGTVFATSSGSVSCPGPAPPPPPNLPRSGPLSTSPFSLPGIGGFFGALSFAESFTTPSFAANWWENGVLLMGIFGFWILIIGGVSSSESIARERDKGTLGALFSQPLRKEEIFLGKFLAKLPLFALISSVYVVTVVALSWAMIAPQGNLEWVPVAILDLTLAFMFFSSVALLLGCIFRRTKSISGFLWLIWIGGFFGLYELSQKGFGTLPWAYFMPGQSVWLPFAGARTYIFDPAGSAKVTYLPQAIGAFFSWGSTSSVDFAIFSTVGLIVDIALFLLLGIFLFRRLEVKD